MIKKALAVFLAAMLLFGAVPLAFAGTYDDLWILYCEDTHARTFTATVVAPAKYTRFSDAPQIEAVNTADPAGNRVYEAQTAEILFYFDGKTETRRTLTVTCDVPDGRVPGYDLMVAVLPGSVLDAAGNGNARVYFDDGTGYLPPGGYADIDVTSGLLRRDYSREDETVAVGDTLRVEYSGLYPVEIRLNGEKAAEFPGGEMQRFTYDITETGPLQVAVVQNGREIETRSLTVITSQEMYERNLRDGLITNEDIPTTGDLVDVGVPLGSPFIPLAKIVAFFVALRDFFQRLFSFSRITN